MVRTLVYVLVTIFVLTFIRAAAGLIGKAVGQLFESETSGHVGESKTGSRVELRKDPVCGVYVSPETRVRKSVSGEEYFFCSESCRDRFKG
jgi:Cu+-exporting ATPase